MHFLSRGWQSGINYASQVSSAYNVVWRRRQGVRFQEEIMQASDDQFVFAWLDLEAPPTSHRGLLPTLARHQIFDFLMDSFHTKIADPAYLIT